MNAVRIAIKEGPFDQSVTVSAPSSRKDQFSVRSALELGIGGFDMVLICGSGEQYKW